jgi:hypothetical protein
MRHKLGDYVLYKNTSIGNSLTEIVGKIGKVVYVGAGDLIHVKFDVCQFPERDYYRLGHDDVLPFDMDFTVDL